MKSRSGFNAPRMARFAAKSTTLHFTGITSIDYYTHFENEHATLICTVRCEISSEPIDNEATHL